VELLTPNEFAIEANDIITNNIIISKDFNLFGITGLRNNRTPLFISMLQAVSVGEKKREKV
jgi:hypothetical protein